MGATWCVVGAITILVFVVVGIYFLWSASKLYREEEKGR